MVPNVRIYWVSPIVNDLATLFVYAIIGAFPMGRS
jgi:hypothetical protein